MILAGSRILGRAFAKALQEEYIASKNAARARASTSRTDDRSESTSNLSGLSLEEAKQILGVSDIYDTAEVAKKYHHLFNVNDKKNGGSLYLQSKVLCLVSRSLELLLFLFRLPIYLNDFFHWRFKFFMLDCCMNLIFVCFSICFLRCTFILILKSKSSNYFT